MKILKNLLHYVRFYFQEFDLALHARRNEWIFVCNASIGDTYLTCALVEAFKMHTGEGTQVTVVVRPNHEPIPRLFMRHIDRIVVRRLVGVLPLVHYCRFHSGVPIVANPSSYGDGRLGYWGGFPGVTLRHLHAFLLDLPSDAKLSKPEISDADQHAAEGLLAGFCVDLKKSVLLAPNAQTVELFPDALWQKLAVFLVKAGWTVFINVDPYRPRTVDAAIPLQFPLNLALPIGNCIGWVISTRSGFCDLLSQATCRLTVLYPDPWRVKLAVGSGSVDGFKTFDLRAMGLRDDAEQFQLSLGNAWTDLRDRLSNLQDLHAVYDAEQGVKG